ncbi:hypothetical protein LWP59_28890 [Amycolatopsis acidiphila]|uniref:Uncharacterized protein n=1 Tax=Amycolatopsis acidiphila TaxID=715473 RepID=A0A557ZV13_9PSEU|nr:hypothetical protein [Amycolatopsis acidiphila]TVT15866.1 hypothetical protein FNH06_35495 [Amycolatopsis acidiphila]UIJ58115.1 hypothetical protein LWP59_28890 [Amycolatopsis acidiphila]GHG69979.1 hypothetical protein GCM10017788_30640 [Amycolatopsis acidiphila]
MLDGVRWFPGARELVTQARAEMPQKNELCGAFVTLVSLRANGISVRDQDEAALAAGVRLGPDATPTWPPGEKSRDDYRLALPRASDPAETGASARGVAHAVETLSAGRMRAVPASGDWTSAALGTLLAGLHGLGWVAPVANVDTGEFGAHDTPDRALLDYLEGGLPPFWSSRWRVGHFALLGGTLSGPGGTVVSIVDSYPSLGDRGVHLQLLDRLVAALRRDGMAGPGGLLLVVDAAEQQAAEELVRSSGLDPCLWP